MMAFSYYEDCDVLVKMEIEFLKFYHYLIADSLQMSDSESKMYFLNKVRDAYCKYSLQNGVSNISFDCAGMRSAYIFSNIPCFTSNVFYHFLNFMHSNPWLLKKAIIQNSLTISCLGGGPGAEVLAIAKALELSLKMFCQNIKPITIYANIVDIDSGWKDTVKRITQKWWKFLDHNYIKLNLSFVQCDPTESLGKNVQDIVKKSDLITMVHFVSAVYGTKCREKISTMLQEIVYHMDKNGVLFYVNCSRFSCVKELRDIIATSIDTDVVYGPIYNDIYQLSKPCLDVCYDLYAIHFGREPPTLQCKNHIVAWRKVEVKVEP